MNRSFVLVSIAFVVLLTDTITPLAGLQGFDFGLTVNPSNSVTGVGGQALTAAVSVTQINGNASVIVGLLGPPGAFLSTTENQPPPFTITLTVTPPSTTGTYTWTITACESGGITCLNGGVTHSATYTLLVSGPDFVASAPASLDFISGTTDTSTISLTSQNGFAGTVTIQTQVTPSTGLAVSCNPSGVTLGPTASTVCTFDSSSPGTYEVALMETSGSISHTTAITVTVQQGHTDLTVDFLRSNSLWLVIGIVGVGVAAAGIVLRRKKGGRTKEPERLGTMPPET